MTVKELEEALATIKNKDMEVLLDGYYDSPVNGYYVTQKDETDVLMLSKLNVQPRIKD